MTRAINSPEPGFFKRRKSGVDADTGERWYGCWVACIIYRPCPIEFNPETFQWVDRFYHLVALENGKPINVDWIWTGGRRLEGEPREQLGRYEFLLDDRAWAVVNAPHLPEANPERAVDVGELDPIF